MERHDSMKRAARYLLGAGTFVAAMLTIDAGVASAQTTQCANTEATVCGHVFTETNGMPDYQPGEGTDTVTVVLTYTDATGTHLADTYQPNPETPYDCTDVNADTCGYYDFTPKTPGDYQVCVVLNDVYSDCRPITIGTVGDTEDFSVPAGGGGEGQPLVWGNGTGTPGYWKNHSSAWPVNSIVIGDPALKTWTFTKEQAIALLSKAVAGDKTYTIFASLVSAMLNVYGNANNPVCIAQEITDAHHWFSLYGGTVGVGSGIKAKTDAWVGGPTNTFKAGELIHTKMDDYNNGLLCAPHRN